MSAKIKVNLARNWFAPNGVLLRKSHNPHTVPADWDLPEGAEEVKADVAVKQEVKAPATKPKAD